jgi:hypothetical protein
VLGIRPPASVRLQVSGTRHRVPATWHLVPDTRYLHRDSVRVSGLSSRYWHLGPDTRYWIDAEGRTSGTEDRARPLENAHIGSAYSRRDLGRGSSTTKDPNSPGFIGVHRPPWR